MKIEPLEPRMLLAGVTLVTHGQADGPPGAWVAGMGDEIAQRLGEAVTRIAITVIESGGQVSASAALTGPAPGATESGEIVGFIDWSELAGGLLFPTNNTFEVAQAVADLMLDPAGVPGLGLALAEFPIHLGGHSRGASLVSELARELGRAGVWVDHLTTWDPYPRGGDAPVGVAQTVRFADNAYQTSSAFITGDPVSGAHDRSLPSMPGGYTSGLTPNHSDVHLWYHGTIDFVGNAFDGEATLNAGDRPVWFQTADNGGELAGFHFSRLIGGERPSDGTHTLLGGSAPREGPDDAGASWPSIVDLAMSAHVAPIVSGTTVTFTTTGDDADSGATITLTLDTDRNPFNANDAGGIGSVALSASPGSAVDTGQVVWNSFGTPTGTYFVRAEISDGVRSRFVYTDQIRVLAFKGIDSLEDRIYRASASWIEPPDVDRPPVLDSGGVYWMPAQEPVS